LPKRVYTRAYASVRFIAPQLDPLDITQALQLPPDHQHRDGEPRLVWNAAGRVVNRGAYRGGQWSLSSETHVNSPRLGVSGVYFAGVSKVAVWIAFLCLPGLLFSIAGLFRPPRRLAGWGVALGVFGSLYLPTFYLSLRAYYRH